MTIRLTDPADVKEYNAARERYDERVQALQGSPGSSWPQNLHPPAPPEPFVDSRDPGLSVLRDERPVSPFGGWGGSCLQQDLLDIDGTSASEVPGYEVQGITPFK